MTIVNRVMEPAPETAATLADHYPVFVCDVCEGHIADFHSAHAAWLYGTTEILHLHTDLGCLMKLEDSLEELLLSVTLEDHFKTLLFTTGFEESLKPELTDTWD